MEKERLAILVEDLHSKFDLVLESNEALYTEIRRAIHDLREEMNEKYKKFFTEMN